MGNQASVSIRESLGCFPKGRFSLDPVVDGSFLKAKNKSRDDERNAKHPRFLISREPFHDQYAVKRSLGTSRGLGLVFGMRCF